MSYLDMVWYISNQQNVCHVLRPLSLSHLKAGKRQQTCTQIRIIGHLVATP